MTARKGQAIPGDWYPGKVPENASIDETALVETTYSFRYYRSEASIGLRMERGSALYAGSILNVGLQGRIHIGEGALVTAAHFFCDAEIRIGDYALVSWGVVLMDTYRWPLDPIERRRRVQQAAQESWRSGKSEDAAQPVHIGRNAWIGFDVCLLPGVTIGEGSIIGARSVVCEDVPDGCVAAGNPARVVRSLRPK